MTGAQVTGIVNKLLAPVRRQARLMVARAIIELVDDSRKLQSVQISMQADVMRDDVERFQQFGFTSVPSAGAEAIAVMVGGNTDHPVVLAIDDRNYRPKSLAEGEVCLYTKQNAKRVYCKADGSIEIGSSPTDSAALASKTKARLDALASAISGWSPTPNDGGAALKLALATWLSGSNDVAAAEVKIK